VKRRFLPGSGPPVPPLRGARGGWAPRAALSLATGALLGLAAPAAASQEGPTRYEALWRAFTAAVPDPGRVARVASLMIQRDAGVLALEEGDLTLATPVAGRVAGAVFVGRGTFLFTPPNAVEAEQLERFYGRRALRRVFDQLVLFFADTTLAELESAATFAPGDPGREAAAAYREALHYVSARNDSSLDVPLAHALLEGRTDGAFYAWIRSRGEQPLVLQLDPTSTEEVRLIRRPAGFLAARGWQRPQEVVCQFRAGGGSSLDLEGDLRPDLAVTAYRIDARFADDLEFSAAAELRAEVRADSLQHLHFELHPELRVDSVAFADGGPARFFRARQGASLWVESGRTRFRGDSLVLRVRYHGKLVEREGDWFRLRAAGDWYPRHDPQQRARFDLTFHHDRGLLLVSVGERVSSAARGRVVTSRWVTPSPIRNASLTLGIFSEHTVEAEGLPAVTVLRSRTARHDLVADLMEEGVAPGGAMERQVAADVVNSFAFFSRVYGPLPQRRLYVSEDPQRVDAHALHGTAFPGLIWLGTGTFMATRRSGEDEMLRAHEVAHQWWPAQVDYRTYHDRWLSEAFAEFSALWFLQTVRRDNRRYFEILEAWRRSILENRKFVLGSGQEAGPIWLGHRTSSTATRGDYHLIVYNKGAWVLHMLRNLLLDLDSMDEDRFLAAMQDFFRTFRGGRASTEDFRRVVETHAGEDLDWFFRQWVYGTKVPAYRFAWRAEALGDGRYRVRCRVEQEGVPEDFRMDVPVRVDLEAGGHARVRARIQGAVTEFELPTLAGKPERVVFNDLMSVLCSVEEIPWR
jgi:hypothetical protein